MTWIDSGSGPGWSSTEPVPRETLRADMRSVLLRHRVIGGYCQVCGTPPVADALCYIAGVAFRWLRDNPA